MSKKLATGDLLVQTINVSQVKLMLKLQFIHEIEIETFIRVFMNSCRRVVSHCDFVDMDETEIADWLTRMSLRLERLLRILTAPEGSQHLQF